MDREWMRRALPEHPPTGFETWMHHRMAEEFVEDMIVFSSERFLYEDAKGKRHGRWVVRCTCTACTYEFETLHIKPYAEEKSFALWQGEDGRLYPIDPLDGITPITEQEEFDDFGYEAGRLCISDGDQIQCPYCGATVEVIHKSKLRGGRTRQLLGCTVQNIQGYTAVICWLTARKWYDDGSYDVYTYPRDAYVIGERGGLTRYRHTKGGGAYSVETRSEEWQLATNMRDSFSVPYHDWRSICNRKVGGCVWPQVCIGYGTGEKTGLETYIKDGGGYPVTYLKVWSKNKTVENLVNSGWSRLIEEEITRYADYNARYLPSQIRGVDFSKSKPHEMLKMSRADFRELSRRRYKWSASLFQEWVEYHDAGGGCSALEFEKYFTEASSTGLAALMTLRETDDQIDFPRVKQYMDKQLMPLSDLHYLVDAREMAEALDPNRELTQAELWPRNLRAVHDRLSRLQAVAKDQEKTASLQAGFDAIREAYGCLEWNDGDLRIILPHSNADLVAEGKILDHCVGGYGKGHTEGRGVIFFVRKYRRPERSYFTLDINMTCGAPSEVQLHGYKNEHVKPYKTRKIPAKVRKFVDRWKKEVLMPFYLQQINKEEKTA